ncbi:hypothetical protein MTO96_034667 [Rhipicephalus appendiculatus]
MIYLVALPGELKADLLYMSNILAIEHMFQRTWTLRTSRGPMSRKELVTNLPLNIADECSLRSEEELLRLMGVKDILSQCSTRHIPRKVQGARNPRAVACRGYRQPNLDR